MTKEQILDKVEIEKLKELYFILKGYLQADAMSCFDEAQVNSIEKVLYHLEAL